MDIPIQYFHGEKPSENKFNKVENRNFVKPYGGLWTSPMVDNITAWEYWCKEEDFDGIHGQLWKVIPKDSTTIYVIDSLSDLDDLLYVYGIHSPYTLSTKIIDYEKLSYNCDLIYLTSKGQFDTRFSEHSLYGWDIECALWLNWKIEETEEVTYA